MRLCYIFIIIILAPLGILGDVYQEFEIVGVEMKRNSSIKDTDLEVICVKHRAGWYYISHKRMFVKTVQLDKLPQQKRVEGEERKRG